MTDETEGQVDDNGEDEAPEEAPAEAPAPSPQGESSRAVLEHKARLEQMDKIRGF